MRISIPKEIKNHEYRVGMTPAGVRELVSHGHQVKVGVDCGAIIGFSNDLYLNAGAEVETVVEELFDWAEMIVKVKEPQVEEYQLLTSNHCLFTYLHLAPDPKQAKGLLSSNCTAIAYETVTDALGRLPLLAPMSEVAGRMSVQAGAHCLEISQGGCGTLLGGVPGVYPGRVTVIGGGVVGINAARMALGLGADVTILDRSLDRLKELDGIFGPRLKTLYATVDTIEESVISADLVIGAVLVPGAAAPKLVNRQLLTKMKPGSVVVDVAVDQGGCFETTRATTHADPTYIEEGVIHYCVANMPGAVARTSTLALTNATLPFVLELADKGVEAALLANEPLRQGLNVYHGSITHPGVADSLGYQYLSPLSAIQKD
ncbi:alanine dehydrogenase [Motiliproteus sp. MSK22-1]|uniref:alanine dehydrogenase n=1 Tax=Motiliproteus sp. MSK22-1 TaxID=1897630 RepID=UPI0009766DD1|nr:alanine dehydrogenase [Motiliproteus sp. MSK22-1]OMH33930.1 alanine dehydrogenase [Motiliproteus sp. MSK22-1]